MFKFFKIAKWIRLMRKKYNRYDFKVVTNQDEIIFYVEGQDDQLRVRY